MSVKLQILQQDSKEEDGSSCSEPRFFGGKSVENAPVTHLL